MRADSEEVSNPGTDPEAGLQFQLCWGPGNASEAQFEESFAMEVLLFVQLHATCRIMLVLLCLVPAVDTRSLRDGLSRIGSLGIEFPWTAGNAWALGRSGAEAALAVVPTPPSEAVEVCIRSPLLSSQTSAAGDSRGALPLFAFRASWPSKKHRKAMRPCRIFAGLSSNEFNASRAQEPGGCASECSAALAASIDLGSFVKSWLNSAQCENSVAVHRVVKSQC